MAYDLSLDWQIGGGCGSKIGLCNIFGCFLNPLSPDINIYSPYCSPYISYGTSKENLSKYI